jgi:hypothetical protein
MADMHEKHPGIEAAPAENNEPLPVEQNGIRVHPQPTCDPLDPLNWSWLQKHTILAIVMLKYFPNCPHCPGTYRVQKTKQSQAGSSQTDARVGTSSSPT